MRTDGLGGETETARGLNPNGEGGLRRPATSVLAVAGVGIALFLALVAYAASGGVRGSDQYWYAAHVAAITEGRGVTDNNIFPVSVYDKVLPLPRPFVHNILNVYLVVPAAMIFGSFIGWLLTNVLCSFATAALIYMTVYRRVGAGPALPAAITYLMLPLTFWQTSQPLAEASMAPLAAAVVCIYTVEKKDWRHWLMLATTAGLLLLCRNSFILLLAAVIFAQILHDWPIRKKTLYLTAALLATAVVFVAIGEFCLEPNVKRSYVQILMSSVPGFSGNMEPFFSLDSISFSIAKFITKAVDSVRTQFIFPDMKSTVLFYSPYNAALFLGLFLMRKKHVRDPVFVAAAFFFLLHIATVVAFQNQPRYVLIPLPAALVGLGVGLGRFRWARVGKWWPACLAVLVTLAVPMNAVLADYLRKDGIEEQQYREQLITGIDKRVPVNEAVMVDVTDTRYLLIGYTLRPRPVLMVSDNYGRGQYERLMENVDAKWFLCRNDSILPEKLSGLVEMAVKLPCMKDELVLYRLTRTSRGRGSG